jgi:hypothetical protein
VAAAIQVKRSNHNPVRKRWYSLNSTSSPGNISNLFKASTPRNHRPSSFNLGTSNRP